MGLLSRKKSLRRQWQEVCTAIGRQLREHYHVSQPPPRIVSNHWSTDRTQCVAFRADCRPLMCTLLIVEVKVSVVSDQTCRYLTRTENCARTYHAGRRPAELREGKCSRPMPTQYCPRHVKETRIMRNQVNSGLDRTIANIVLPHIFYWLVRVSNSRFARALKAWCSTRLRHRE
jgi:hypothetical protein